MAQWFGEDKIAIIHQNVQKVSVFKESITRFGVLWMKRPMEHYLDDLRPVLHFAATNYQESGRHVIWHR